MDIFNIFCTVMHATFPIPRIVVAHHEITYLHTKYKEIHYGVVDNNYNIMHHNEADIFRYSLHASCWSVEPG